MTARLKTRLRRQSSFFRANFRNSCFLFQAFVLKLDERRKFSKCNDSLWATFFSFVYGTLFCWEKSSFSIH